MSLSGNRRNARGDMSILLTAQRQGLLVCLFVCAYDSRYSCGGTATSETTPPGRDPEYTRVTAEEEKIENDGTKDMMKALPLVMFALFCLACNSRCACGGLQVPQRILSDAQLRRRNRLPATSPGS